MAVNSDKEILINLDDDETENITTEDIGKNGTNYEDVQMLSSSSDESKEESSSIEESVPFKKNKDNKSIENIDEPIVSNIY